jgi:hypothetical protein
VRLIGIGMSHLNNVGGEQLSLFQTEEQTRRGKVSKLIDTIRAKHGETPRRAPACWNQD